MMTFLWLQGHDKHFVVHEMPRTIIQMIGDKEKS